MEYILSLLWVGLEFLSLLFVCKALMPLNMGKIKTALSLLSIWILYFILGITGLLSSLPIRPFILLFGLLFSVLSFRGPWYIHLIAVIMHYLSLSIIDSLVVYGTAALLRISLSELIWRKWLYAVMVTAGKCILLFLSWSFFCFRTTRKNFHLSTKRLLLITIFPLVSIVMICTIFESYKTQDDLSISAVVFCVILGISNVAIIYLLNSLERASRAEQEVAILNQSMALQTENIIALEKSYRMQRSVTHEFKHQLKVIYDLLENGDSATVREYISQLQSSHTSRIFAVNTNHPIVDAILNEKYHMAKEADIDIHYKVNDLSSLALRTDALVVLLSNLLENAIEACERLQDNRMIEFTILLEDILFLSIRNTAPPVIIMNGQIETTKDNKAEHGFGLAGVRRVLTQLNGEYVMDYTGNWFQFVAEIPVK